MDCPVKHCCPVCRRQWTHTLIERGYCDVVPSRIRRNIECAECSGISFVNERFIDEFLEWAEKTRKRHGLES